MKKIVIIGDSNQAFLLPLKIAVLLGCPVFSGHEDKSNRAYCSSSDWPEVKKYTTSEKKYKISLQSLFPWASMEIRVPKVLGKLHADEDTVLILQSSTNDITNLVVGCELICKVIFQNNHRKITATPLKLSTFTFQFEYYIARNNHATIKNT